MTFLKSIIAVLMLSVLAAIAQPKSMNVQLDFRPVLGSMPLQLDTIYTLTDNHYLEVSTLKWYISGVELLRNDSVVFTERNSYHLLDAADTHSLHISLPQLPFHEVTHVRFLLGIDSTTTNSGAFGGNLDPTRGMYWTWQSGYIHTKIEGKSSRSSSKNQEFEFHLGGYQYPYNSLQTITLPLPALREFIIKMDIVKYMNSIDLARVHHVMSPGEQAVFLSQQFSSIFRSEAR